MTRHAHKLLLVAVTLAVTATAAFAQRESSDRLYRWVDDEGNVHFGDRIPPEYANRDRDLLNRQGVTVGFEEGEITPEERAEIERQERIAAEREREHAERARRDRMLLETYLSVEDIENLRDRRLELLESQIKVTELYLSNLHKRLEQLENEASRFQPRNESEDAPRMPENLALDLSRTRASIELYEQTLNRTRDEQDELRQAFALDIERFRELKGG